MSLLPSVPEASLQILHPINIAYVLSSILIYTLRSFSPATLVVRRVHHHRRINSSTHHNQQEPAEELSVLKDNNDSETSRVMSESAEKHRRRRHRLLPPVQSSPPLTSDNAVEGTAVSTRYLHRRHHRSRSDSGSRGATPSTSVILSEDSRASRSRRRHSAPSLPSSSGAVVRARRSHSMEEDSGRFHRKTSHSSHRSLSDTASVTSRHGDSRHRGSNRSSRENSVDASASKHHRSRHRSESHTSMQDKASKSQPESANNSFSAGHRASGDRSSGLPAGTFLMPPPMIGKPPLSGRRRSTVAILDTSVASSTASRVRRGPDAKREEPADELRRHHRSLHRSPSRSRAERTTENARASAARPSQHSSSRSRRPFRRLRRLCKQFGELDMTQPAYLLAHVLRAVPVSCIHHWCYLKQKLAALHLMNFRDTGKAMWKVLDPAVASLTKAGRRPSARGAELRSAVPAKKPFYDSSLLLQFHVLRMMMQMIDDYLEGVLFLDKSLVVRNLRSRRVTRQIVGWAIRLTSRTILDTFLLSVVTPILLASADHFQNPLLNIRLTIPGLLRGLGCGCAGVLLQWLLIPVTSQLINRGVVTVYEGIEYVLLRRYATTQVSDDSEDDDESDAVNSQAGSVMSRHESDTEARDGAPKRAPNEKEKRVKYRTDPSRMENAKQKEKGTKAESAQMAEDVMKQLRREIRKEKREEVRRRRARKEQREAEVRGAILRAILYRISGSLVAQCAVEHPLNVAVELLRGRAMMHMCGLLSYYDESKELDTLCWVGLKSFCRKIIFPTARRAGVDDTDEIPHWVWLLRQIGATVGVEIQMLTECVQRASGQSEALHRLKQNAFDTIRAGGRPSAWESVELMARCMLSFAPLYYYVQLTAVDKLLGFYMAIWTRLTKT